ncbi:uncharacterized protein LOC105228615 [Bactrocera dorsalis]|uniref:Uncharacterized protein LOC105228615 n=1 Tax=Bactrocera dorsalis TaxID=27457 RepID=A0ABM3JHH3_BACDO|nr:uncharacterized protein LOC105228615 [Bactrocera dorsalis]
MQQNQKIAVLLLCIGVLTLNHCCEAKPADERATRQTKEPHSDGATQAEVKTLSGPLLNGAAQVLTQPQGLAGFGGVVGLMPYPRYGGLAYGGSGYTGAPGMGLLGLPLSGSAPGVPAGANGALPGVNTLQLGNLAGLNYPATGNYVGNNLPPYPFNGPDMYANYMFGALPQLQNNFGPTVAGANSLDNLVNMANLQGVTGNGNQLPPPTQTPLQGQASQLQPQLSAAYPFPSGIFGQMGGYGQGFQGYPLL